MPSKKKKTPKQLEAEIVALRAQIRCLEASNEAYAAMHKKKRDNPDAEAGPKS